MSTVYQPDEPMGEPEIEAMAQPIVQVERYMTVFDSLESSARFARAVRHLPIKDSRLYKERDRYYLVIELDISVQGIAYEMRRLSLEYSELVQMGSPELDHVEEEGDLLIRYSAVERLIEMGL